MTPARPLACLAVTAAVLAAASLPASGAGPAKPVVGAQTTQTSGRFPVAIPGQKPPVKAGAPLRRGQTIVSRGVTMSHGQRTILSLLCPAGTVQRGLGVGAASTVAFEVINVKRYIGSRRVAIRAIAAAPSSSQSSTGHVYGLCS